MSNPKLSVIMGVYNISNLKFLKDAIDSIINQTFQEWEFVICDDGSDEYIYNFIEKEYGNNKKIVIIKNNKNMGLHYSLNKCIEHSKSQYLVRQDADDISDPSRLEILYKQIITHSNYDVIGTSMILFDEDGVWGTRHPRKLSIAKRDFLKGSVVAHATTILKKKSVVDVGGYRVSWETSRCEDYDLFMRMYSKGYKIKNIDDELYMVREDKSAYSRKKYINRVKEAVVRIKGFTRLKMPIWGYIYVLKPLIIGLIPSNMQLRIKKRIEKHAQKTQSNN